MRPRRGCNSGWRIGTHPCGVADITNDGFADLVGIGFEGVWTAVGNRDNADFGSGRGWTVAQHPRLLADVTGEGWADVVGFGNAGVFVALANGSGGFTGGPEVAAVPSMRGLGYDQARERLAADGLRVGSIGGVEDRSCDFIDKVMSSNPSAGTEVAVGTAVTLTIGEQLSTPCP